MSANKSTQPEPSMEEILASIRRIISEDGDTPKVANAKAAPAPPAITAPVPAAAPTKASPPKAPPPVAPPAMAAPVVPAASVKPARSAAVAARAEAAVLELTEMVDAPAPAPGEGEAGDELVSQPVEDKTARTLASLRQAKAPPFVVPAIDPGPAIAEMIQALAPKIEQLARDQLAELLQSLGGRLETIAREELRPMLQAWLDQNLAAMVERLVENEIKRISRRSG